MIQTSLLTVTPVQGNSVAISGMSFYLTLFSVRLFSLGQKSVTVAIVCHPNRCHCKRGSLYVNHRTNHLLLLGDPSILKQLARCPQEPRQEREEGEHQAGLERERLAVHRAAAPAGRRHRRNCSRGGGDDDQRGGGGDRRRRFRGRLRDRLGRRFEVRVRFGGRAGLAGTGGTPPGGGGCRRCGQAGRGAGTAASGTNGGGTAAGSAGTHHDECGHAEGQRCRRLRWSRFHWLRYRFRFRYSSEGPKEMNFPDKKRCQSKTAELS